MRTVGIVCEYNPFHNGHLNHMRRAMAQPDGEYVVCVLSSDFLQRGEPAILPKNLRAETAVRNGADLVFELPNVFSCSSAEYYASSALLMMDRLGIVDSLVFGSENHDIKILKEIAGILVDEPDEYRGLLRQNLSSGISFARARALALSAYSGNPAMKDVIEGSNNILGIEYIKAIIKNGLPIKPVSVPRIASAYKDEDITGKFPSATAIRRSIFQNGLESVRDFLPPPAYSIMENFYSQGIGYIGAEMLKDAIYYRIASLSPGELCEYPGVSEGLENRLKSELSPSSSLEDYIERCATKRYPKTRISRTLMHILLDLKSGEADAIRKAGPLYARLLAASKRGMDLVPILEKNARIPVFTSLRPFHDIARPSWKKLLDRETKASDIYSVAAGLPSGRDYTMKFNVL
ncbi:MAG: nucleotidyltransferase family protein [Clostridia bacterium]|nr:nucleotidyltransferase family protein [Clostridia bacterium]